jgi:dTDP-glucose pyrophosphorylase
MKNLNIVIPLAGLGSRFSKAGYKDPKPFIDINGVRMIEMVINNIKPSRPHKFIFIAKSKHLSNYNGYDILNNAANGCTIIPINENTQGAACTVLLAKEFIDNEEPLMIANSDQLVNININTYLNQVDKMYEYSDAVIMTMRRKEPKWSFCGRNAYGYIDKVVEKQPISNEATVGIYNFKRGSDFVKSAEIMIAKNKRYNNEFYVAPVFNELIEQGGRVEAIEIYNYQFNSLGTPEDLEDYINNKLVFRL